MAEYLIEPTEVKKAVHLDIEAILQNAPFIPKTVIQYVQQPYNQDVTTVLPQFRFYQRHCSDELTKIFTEERLGLEKEISLSQISKGQEIGELLKEFETEIYGHQEITKGPFDL